MTRKQDAGRINAEWLANARRNADDDEIEEWFAEALNQAVQITHDGHVWAGSGWLSQEAIDDACKRIDGGV